MPLRVIVIDLSVGEDPAQLIKLVNPEFVEREGEQRHEEGCLSVPGYGGSPVRPARVVSAGSTPTASERVYSATELLARAFCHEIDHIDGLLFVDRLSPLKRDLLSASSASAPGRAGRNEPVRIVFLGSGAFAIPSFEALLAAGHEVAALVTQPDKEKGRGAALAPPPLKPVAQRRGVPVLQPRRVREPGGPRGSSAGSQPGAAGRRGLRPDPAPQRHRHRAAGHA